MLEVTIIKLTVDNLTIEFPNKIKVGREVIELTKADITAVYDQDDSDDEPIGFDISYDTLSHGSVINGVTLDEYGEVWILDGLNRHG